MTISEEEMAIKLSEINKDWIDLYPHTSLVNENLHYLLRLLIGKYQGLLVDSAQRTVTVAIMPHPEAICTIDNILY